jgi:hypothetical protein
LRLSRFQPAILAALLFAALPFVTRGARADDQPFVTLYTTDIDTQGEREAEQWLTWSAGHAHGSYGEFFSQSEFEYGVTDDFQASLYLDYDWARERMAPEPANTTSLVAVHGELIYRVLNVYFDPFGLAFYLEPSEGPGERGVETKILLQKNFLNDTLRFAFNMNFEDTWDRTPNHWARTSALEFDAGLAYNVTPDFSVGMEFDNERAYDGLVLGSPASEQTSAFFIGPTIQYVGQPATITLGMQTQLPWAENASRTPGATENGFVADAERYRITLRLSKDF